MRHANFLPILIVGKRWYRYKFRNFLPLMDKMRVSFTLAANVIIFFIYLDSIKNGQDTSRFRPWDIDPFIFREISNFPWNVEFPEEYWIFWVPQTEVGYKQHTTIYSSTSKPFYSKVSNKSTNAPNKSGPKFLWHRNIFHTNIASEICQSNYSIIRVTLNTLWMSQMFSEMASRNVTNGTFPVTVGTKASTYVGHTVIQVLM